ncbi:MAG: S41 family peptidase [Chloroflexi bacterium]|nr:S41 family peptidase [Chloroflexota bacterium]
MVRSLKVSVVVLLMTALVILSFGVGYGVANRTSGDSTATAEFKHPSVSTPRSEVTQGVPPEFSLLPEVWQILKEEFVKQDTLKEPDIGRSTIDGLLKALDDPHTSYVSPDDFRLERSAFTGNFEGIGAQVTMVEGQLTVIAPIAGSPAQAAGIKAGDIIAAVDGQSLEGINLSQAISRIRGPKGTSVRLTIIHGGEAKPVEITVVRDIIKTASVFASLRPDKIAHIGISSFSDSTDTEMRKALKDMKDQGATGIVLDLRNNPGGLLDTTVQVASEFLSGGIVLYEEDRDGNRQPAKAKSGGVAIDIPLVVLVNEGSASGSEVLAGALQDRGRAKLVGVKTFGKGSINHIRELSNGGALTVTFARWLTPNQRQIEGQGLEPDIKVELTKEDAQAGRDTQLERALQVLKNGA